MEFFHFMQGFLSSGTLGFYCTRNNHPVLFDTGYVIFIQSDLEYKDYYLYKYDINRKVIIKLSDLPADEDSRPSINNKGDILFVSLQNNEHNINILKSSGQIDFVASGRYPNWYDGFNSILYYDKNGALWKHDILYNNNTELAKGVYLLSTPTYGKDQNIIAFFEIDSIGGFSGASMEFLSIMDLRTKSKKRIESYHDSARRLGYYSVYWTE